MLHRGGTFRLLVSILLMMAVPFCCCNFHTLVHNWAGCADSAATEGRMGCSETAAPTTGPGHEHAACGMHENDEDEGLDAGVEPRFADKEPGVPNALKLPGLPGHGEHDSCACGSHVSKLPAAAKVSFELSALMVVAIVDWALMSGVTTPDQAVVYGDDERGVARPRTSLLRLHCALMV